MPPSIKIVTRAEWKACPPVHSEPLKTPVDTVLLMYTGAANHMTEKEVLSILPAQQLVCIKEWHQSDIIYNWLIDFNGNIYEGRGWKTSVEKNSYTPYGKFDGISLDIGLIGHFGDKNPPRSMERVVTALLEWGMTEKFVVDTKDLKIYNWKDFPVEHNHPNAYLRKTV